MPEPVREGGNPRRNELVNGTYHIGGDPVAQPGEALEAVLNDCQRIFEVCGHVLVIILSPLSS
jgi:hypothetical protein